MAMEWTVCGNVCISRAPTPTDGGLVSFCMRPTQPQAKVVYMQHSLEVPRRYGRGFVPSPWPSAV